jgi:hypothetical protein
MLSFCVALDTENLGLLASVIFRSYMRLLV